MVSDVTGFRDSTMALSRPSRIIQPTAKLSTDNAGNIELKSHKQAIEKARQHAVPTLPMPESLPSQSTNVATTVSMVPNVTHSNVVSRGLSLSRAVALAYYGLWPRLEILEA